jgi:DNA invertase Pin-like site-specific DNA recombinase
MKQVGAPTKAILYCRISSTSQQTGHGLESQEHRCRLYAEAKSLPIAEVFYDDFTGAGDFMKRPGMVRLLKYLDAHPHENFVLIIDDLKRMARDTFFHLKLRQTLASYGATLECLNFRFEDTPESQFVETIVAASGELERRQNRRQNLQKTKACLERGIWPFKIPIGYKRIKRKGQPLAIVKDEPFASIIKQAFEGFASGRFATQGEVLAFLNTFPQFPKYREDCLHPQQVKNLLSRVIYTGYIEFPKWGVDLRKANFEPIVSFATYQKVQDILNGTYKPAFKNPDHPDFILRKAVVCSECKTILTSYWSRGRHGNRYAYYSCRKHTCGFYAKTIKRAVIEDAFFQLLKDMAPPKVTVAIARRMLEKHWDHRLKYQEALTSSVKDELQKVERKVKDLLNRIVNTDNPMVVEAYETKLAELTREQVVCKEKIANCGTSIEGFEDTCRTAMDFIQNPYNWFISKEFTDKKLIFKFLFEDKLEWDHNGAFRTPKKTLPFKTLEEKFMRDGNMVPVIGNTPENSLLSSQYNQ